MPVAYASLLETEMMDGAAAEGAVFVLEVDIVVVVERRTQTGRVLHRHRVDKD